jgi:hypothetical protein
MWATTLPGSGSVGQVVRIVAMASVSAWVIHSE